MCVTLILHHCSLFLSPLLPPPPPSPFPSIALEKLFIIQ